MTVGGIRIDIDRATGWNGLVSRSNDHGHRVMLVKCFCTNCAGHLEFEEENAGEKITCPHCGFQTTLFLPGSQPPDAEVADSVTRRARLWRRLLLSGFCLAVAGVALALWLWALPWVQNLLGEEVSRWVAVVVLLLGCVLGPLLLVWCLFWFLFPFLVFHQLITIRRLLERIDQRLRLDAEDETEDAEESAEGADED